MSRYRPPRPIGSDVITPEGVKCLRDELDALWRIERPKVTQAVSESAALGDRSENAEYIYGKKRLREIDSRVFFLRKRLETLRVINHIPSDNSRIYFGAWIELLDQNNCHHRYRIVGPDEFDLNQGHISIDSPLARSLLGKMQSEVVEVNTPSGLHEYEIISVRYET